MIARNPEPPTLRCTECKEAKLPSDFQVRRNVTRGRSYYCKNCLKKRTLDYKYGISEDDYNRMLEEQGGVCAICKRTERMHSRLVVDHDHSTGAIRGLLCSNCNKGIGFFGESCEALQLALGYLEKYKA